MSVKKIIKRLLGMDCLYADYLTKKDISSNLWRYWLLTRRRKVSPQMFPDTWCSYLIALYESGNLKAFDCALQDFTKRGGGARQIRDFLILSQIFCERGERDVEVVRTAQIARRLETNHKNGVFAEFVKGKSVAVVGNGPSEMGHGLGSEIDAHDVVIRINNHTVKGFEADYGTRTDMWAKHTTDYLKHERTEPGIKFILYAANWMRDRLVYGYREAIENDLKDCIVDYCDAKDRQPLTEGLGIHPTTGALLIEMLRKTEMKSLDVYGFSFLESKPADTYTHYMNDMSSEKLKKEVAAHKMDVEMAYLKTLFRNGRRYNP